MQLGKRPDHGADEPTRLRGAEHAGIVIAPQYLPAAAICIEGETICAAIATDLQAHLRGECDVGVGERAGLRTVAFVQEHFQSIAIAAHTERVPGTGVLKCGQSPTDTRLDWHG